MPVTPSDPERRRPFAAITGASSGIGEVFARRLAAAGHSLLLVARRDERLRQLADELQGRHRVDVMVHRADLSKSVEVDALGQRLSGIKDLDLLINNAGFGTMGDFIDVPLAFHREMMHVHVYATTSLTHAVLPGMIRQRRGDIINVTSMAAFLICPGSAMYGATKSFMKSFSDSLNAELAGTNVRIQALCPGMTFTGFHDTEQFRRFDRAQIARVLWMSADDVVDASLRALRRRREVCVPGLRNRVLAALFLARPIRKLAGRAVRKKPKPEVHLSQETPRKQMTGV